MQKFWANPNVKIDGEMMPHIWSKFHRDS